MVLCFVAARHDETRDELKNLLTHPSRIGFDPTFNPAPICVVDNKIHQSSTFCLCGFLNAERGIRVYGVRIGCDVFVTEW